MLSQKALKQLGVLGLSVGLLASPQVFADMHEEPAQDPGTTQEQGAMGDPATDPGAAPAGDSGVDPAADPQAGQPAEEPGFGTGTDPMPGGDAQTEPGAEPGAADEEAWEEPTGEGDAEEGAAAG